MRVRYSSHDPDFDLAKGSRQMALFCRAFVSELDNVRIGSRGYIVFMAGSERNR